MLLSEQALRCRGGLLLALISLHRLQTTGLGHVLDLILGSYGFRTNVTISCGAEIKIESVLA